MQKIDLAVWPRAELFRFFSGVSQPFYSVTFRVDVTNLHAYTKAHGISFYYALCYLATDAVNAVENFRYTIRDGEVFLLDGRISISLPCQKPAHWTGSATPPKRKVTPSRAFLTRAANWTT